MELTSAAFFSFFAIVFAAFYFFPPRLQTGILLCSSYIFYFTWSWQFASILLAYTLFNFIWARIVINGKMRGKALLWVGILVNLAVWTVFKYSEFFTRELSSFLEQIGLSRSPEAIRLLLPIGMSFFVLQGISYLIDVYQGVLPGALPFTSLALYMAYFPKLLSGPIERASAFVENLSKNRVVDGRSLSESTMLIILGLFRKLVLGDSLRRMIPMEFYSSPELFPSPLLLVWLLAFSFSLYNDFAGYTDIARGVSALFGIQLPRNFAHPYFISSISDFWTRWHITLTMWLRDYVYLPLSRWFIRRYPGNFRRLSIIVPPIATMFASGLWHGANSRMLVWGLMMGIYLAIERLVGVPVKIRKLPGPAKLVLALIFFFIATVPSLLLEMEISTVVAFTQSLFKFPVFALFDIRPLVLVGVSLSIDFLQFRSRNEYVFVSWPLIPRAATLSIAILILFLVSRTNPAGPFIYQGF